MKYVIVSVVEVVAMSETEAVQRYCLYEHDGAYNMRCRQDLKDKGLAQVMPVSFTVKEVKQS